MRTSNPALSEKAFTFVDSSAQRMTLQGTVAKTGILLAVVLTGAIFGWRLLSLAPASVLPATFGGAIVGFLLAMVIMFKPKTSPYLAPVYALAEGVFLGALSGFMQTIYPGIVLPAILLTFGVAGSLLAAYASGLVRATENFKLGIMAATGGIAIVYLATFVLGFMGIQIPYIHGSGLIGIGFSLVVVVIAALNLVLDFDFIEKGVENGAPKYMEWYASFGLLVTLVWLYLELLRLLAKLQGRD
ncbi:MAG: Bax inhibitor-1/YccA family protein [Planctomycetota bacterium]|nr:Bax inhibitor-1/YccA family protein [Planctomycetota bacterium]MEC7447414.1 Bax inhibitor-1/YccA family protein [Planctomycetota bacterium]MEC7720065.1 Bax inhibitor-1/YccA family protein [Planctomycetota bacterium]MEC8160532.1 Bax inhibitor-1/YccA family protein [Planctomycetota bacterium]MEC8302658.1 Bax inhibitor-1/YccA family protein [Planctomycetota bacterium]